MGATGSGRVKRFKVTVEMPDDRDLAYQLSKMELVQLIDTLIPGFKITVEAN